MRLAYAGAASGCPKNTQFIHRLTGADVMSWKPKSRLQKLFERLIKAASQEGNP